MNSISTALAGIQSASIQFDNAAQKIANSDTPGDATDMAAQIIQLTAAQYSMKFDTTIIRTQDEMDQTLLDIRA